MKLRAVDLFCGAGGTSAGAESTGEVELTLGVNHWDVAVRTHEANFPNCRHINSRLKDIPPSEASPFNLLFASPECTFFSRGRSGKPTSDQQRAGAFEILPWIEHHRPSWIVIENVPEFRDWGPVYTSGKNRGKPIPQYKGKFFEAWLMAIRGAGYKVEFHFLNAADFGAATSRTRFIMIARKGNRNPVFPEPTHGRKAGGELPGMGLQPWRAAAEIIDWSIPCPSVFRRKRDLKPKTLARIEAGLRRFVAPFVLSTGSGGSPRRVDQPLPTIVTRDGTALTIPFQVILRNNMNSADLDSPVNTITAGGGHHGLAMPFLLSTNHGEDGHAHGRTKSVRKPFGTVTTKNGEALILPFQFQMIGRGAGRSKSAASPVPTIIATRENHGIVFPWLIHYYGTNNQSPVTDPVDTITTVDRHALSVALCRGPQDWPEPNSDAMRSLQATMTELGISDIGFRMFSNPELALAQSFDANYIFHGKKSEVTRQIGNSVPPALAKAVTMAILSV